MSSKVDVYVPQKTDERTLAIITDGLNRLGVLYRDQKLRFNISRENVDCLQMLFVNNALTTPFLNNLADVLRDENHQVAVPTMEVHNENGQATFLNGEWRYY